MFLRKASGGVLKGRAGDSKGKEKKTWYTSGRSGV